MGSDDENVGGAGECPGHEWDPVDVQVVEREGMTGLAIVHECIWCDGLWYEGSNLDRFVATRGLDPALYPKVRPSAGA